MSHDIVVAHNHYPATGGGERVANRLAKTFDAPIVTAWIDDGKPAEEVPVIELIDGLPLEKFIRKYIMPNPTYRNLYYRWLWETGWPLHDYDVIIQSGGHPSWYCPDDDQIIIKYIHSPPRQPFDLFAKRTEKMDYNPILHPRSFIGHYLDRKTKQKARERNLWRNLTNNEIVLANSELVANRIKTYYGIPQEEIEVVYPPVEINRYEPVDEDDGYYLALSRLTPAKRFDTIIEAFHELNKHGDYPLKIVGDGHSRDELEDLVGDVDYIEFEGYVSEERKQQLLTNAKASVFCAENEDFGIVPVESMAAGTPVIGVRDGYTRFQIQDGDNGILFDRSVEGLVSAIKEYESCGVAWDASMMHKFTEQFSRERFETKMRAVVDRAIQEHEVESKVKVPEMVQND